MLKLITFLRYYIYRACSIIVKLFLSGIHHFRPFFLFLNFFKNNFEHINGTLLGLFWKTKKCKSDDLRGVAFYIRQTLSIIFKFKGVLLFLFKKNSCNSINRCYLNSERLGNIGLKSLLIKLLLRP